MSKYFWEPVGKVPKFPDEAWVKKQIKNQLERLSIWWFMPSSSAYGVSGIPDFVCCSVGMFISIEAKDADGIWSEHQQERGIEIGKVKGVYILVDEDGLDRLWHFLTQWVYSNELPQGIHDFRGLNKTKLIEERKK